MSSNLLLFSQIVGIFPPSMTYSLPVIEDARSEARNAINSATSSGRLGRPSGIQFACLCWLGCSCTARKEQCNGERDSNENRRSCDSRFCFHASSLAAGYGSV